MPFVLAYNKKHASPLVPTPLDAAALCSVMIDDQPAANIAAAAPGGGGGEGGGEGGEGGGGSAGAPTSFSDILRKPACMLLPPHTKRSRQIAHAMYPQVYNPRKPPGRAPRNSNGSMSRDAAASLIQGNFRLKAADRAELKGM